MNIHENARSTPRSRATLVSRVREQGWSPGAAAQAAGISVRTAYKWLRRHRAEGEAGLRDRRCRAHSRPHALPKDWCDVVELVHEVVKRVEDNNAGRRIHISINQGMPLCRMDKGILEQVIYNLLNNAAIHTEEKARIDITATCHADLLEFIIEDSGKGFSNVNVKEVFHKFSREKKHRPNGSGLGLSIVKGFTEALGGTVEVKNIPTSGAQFTVTLPVKTSYINTRNE